MKANNITLTVIVEVLSIDSITALLVEVARNIDDENTRGSLIKGDGDSISWDYAEKAVEV